MAANPVQDDVDAFSESCTNDFVNKPSGSPSGDRDHPNLTETEKLQAGHTYVSDINYSSVLRGPRSFWSNTM
ncbi:hypothetical protein GJ744_004074 [Endocarpon pusillum]|uniref:Uncharacterized protein n=1 Tax=Endocarpon pusillum TaxID=364733 RepID=A0A8H7E1Q4_9EURO|nr:hypothetical protein GJ744_004074 [Endocarpon pusillum]